MRAGLRAWPGYALKDPVGVSQVGGSEWGRVSWLERWLLVLEDLRGQSPLS